MEVGPPLQEAGICEQSHSFPSLDEGPLQQAGGLTPPSQVPELEWVQEDQPVGSFRYQRLEEEQEVLKGAAVKSHPRDNVLAGEHTKKAGQR